ncbi:MAG TPA: amidohydrolase family protein [Streptosporangiaceae bacterium]|nr:amidohydrolase family protein [Streptosporangiaceae bacterium]
MTRTVLTGGRVFDGTGSAVKDADVVISEGKIADVGPGLDGDQQVDVSGLTILPGFIDCHVHVMVSGIDLVRRLQRPFSYPFFQAAKNLEATLDCGITTVRDAGGADLGIQRAVEDGLIDGPRLQIAISALSQTGGHGDGWLPSGITTFLLSPHPGRPHGIADGPEEVRKRVREIIRAGANVIKVHTSGGVLSPRDSPKHAQFQPDELAALMAEAAAAGLPVMAHAQATDGIKNAVRAGVRSIEHGIYLDDEAIDMMLRAGTWLVPTLVAPQAVLNAVDTGSQLPEGVAAKAREVIDAHASAFARAAAAGVKIAMGTDTGVGPHGSNLDELPLMAAGGMTPAQVLTATTKSAAELLRISDETGTIMPGKRADLVAVAGDPFDLPKLKSNIRAVYSAGRKVRG